MLKFEPLYIEEQLRYRCCYHYKTHCRYVAVILALTALATTLSVCLALRTVQTQQETKIKEAADPGLGTACGHRMAHRKWKETKQQPSMLPGPDVPGCSLIFFYFLWAIPCPQAVLVGKPKQYVKYVSKVHGQLCDSRKLYIAS